MMRPVSVRVDTKNNIKFDFKEWYRAWEGAPPTYGPNHIFTAHAEEDRSLNYTMVTEAASIEDREKFIYEAIEYISGLRAIGGDKEASA